MLGILDFGLMGLKRLRAFLSLFRKSKKHKKKHFHTELTPTHGDLVPQNILVSGADIRLIDWEYARLNDP